METKELKNEECLPQLYLVNLQEIYGIGNLEIPTVMQNFGWWLVMDNCDVVIIAKCAYETIENKMKTEPYLVEESTIFDADWIEHLRGKGWFTQQCEKDFISALLYARYIRKQSELKKGE